DLSALPLRPGDAPRLEDAPPAVARQHPRHGHRAPARAEAGGLMAARVVNVRAARDAMSLEERAYLPEVIRGLGLTMKHFFANLFARKYTVTVPYPEEKIPYAERFRGRHRLMVRDDGQVRCVACMCCSTACPTNCITIE